MLMTPKTPFEVRLGFREHQLVAFARSYSAAQGISPSYNEIVAELGLDSRGHACNIIRRLEAKGIASREGSGRDRRLRLR